MREIKYRAWQRKEQRMIGPEELEKAGFYIDPNGHGFTRKTEGSETLQYFSVMIPLLYSGKKDKKNVEIYEGDIISYQNKIYQLLWYDTGLWLIREDGKPISLVDINREAEVVGNLYSNPEMINA